MEKQTKLIQNWLTRGINPRSFIVTAALVFVLFSLSLYDWMSAKDLAVSYDLAFTQHKYWRLWSALFAHADMGHLLGNALFFVPFALLLTGYFNLTLFPLAGLFIGGIINALAVKTMMPTSELMGISGVVNWMGAVWLTLFFLVDRRTNWRRRFAVALFSSLVLFAPQEFKPDVSYVSHLIGFGLGIVSGIIYYIVHRKEFLAAEIYEVIAPDIEEPILEA